MRRIEAKFRLTNIILKKYNVSIDDFYTTSFGTDVRLQGEYNSNMVKKLREFKSKVHETEGWVEIFIGNYITIILT